MPPITASFVHPGLSAARKVTVPPFSREKTR